MSTLHIYGQAWPHDPVHIVGTQLALLQLIHACLDAVGERPRGPCGVWTADGEGSDLLVTLVPDEQAMRASVRPYTDAAFRDVEADASPRWPRKAEEGGSAPPGQA